MRRSTWIRVAVSLSLNAIVVRAVTLSAASAKSTPAKPAGSAKAAAIPSMVPPGVTLVEGVRELSTSSAQLLWVRPGDASGRTLLISDKDQPGVSNCVDECAKEFPP